MLYMKKKKKLTFTVGNTIQICCFYYVERYCSFYTKYAVWI